MVNVFLYCGFHRLIGLEKRATPHVEEGLITTGVVMRGKTAMINAYSKNLVFLVTFVDIVLLEFSGMLAANLHFGAAIDQVAPVHAILLHSCSAFACLVFKEMGLYDSWRGRSLHERFMQLAGALSIILLAGLLFSFLLQKQGTLSQLWMLYWFGSGLVALATYRVLMYSALKQIRKKGSNLKKVLLVGYGSTAQEMHRRATTHHWAGYDICAVYVGEDNHSAQIDPSLIQLLTVEDIPQYVLGHKIKEIWITLPIESKELQQVQFLLRNELIDIRWFPDVMSLHILNSTSALFLGLPAVDLNQPLSGGINGLVKSLFDKAVAVLALILLLPLFITIAIFIKCTSPGPVFFKQARLGLNGKQFNVYKFRSMKLHDERGVVRQASKQDSRFTPIGAFLRRTSLDELPQFINVLLGDMSVVGPRPHALQHNEMYKNLVEQYMLRHRVKPGITGWAQINGYRGETDTVDKMAKRVEFDLYYIRNWSIWMDTQIVVWTAFKGWTGRNAY